MCSIVICNLRNTKFENAYDVRVDRYNKVLGNKFYMSNENKRDLVCEQYKEWFYRMIAENNAEVINELNRLLDIYKRFGKLRLFCWCYPLRCHSETIKEYLMNEINKERL